MRQVLVLFLFSIFALAAHAETTLVTKVSCPAMTEVNAKNAVFYDIPDMMKNLQGKWVGKDCDGKEITFSFDQGKITGTINRYETYYSTYDACTWEGVARSPLVQIGQYDLRINHISCLKGDGREPANSIGLINAYGGKSKIDFLILKLDDKQYGIVRKVQ